MVSMDIDKQDQSISLSIFTSFPKCTECGVLDCQFEVGLFGVPYVFCPSLSLVLPWHQHTQAAAAGGMLLGQHVLCPLLHGWQWCSSSRWQLCCWVSHGICWTSRTLFCNPVDLETLGFHDVVFGSFVSPNVFSECFKYSSVVLGWESTPSIMSVGSSFCKGELTEGGGFQRRLHCWVCCVFFTILKYFGFQTDVVMVLLSHIPLVQCLTLSIHRELFFPNCSHVCFSHPSC